MTPPNLPAPNPDYKRPTIYLVDAASDVRIGFEIPIHSQTQIPRCGEGIVFYQDGIQHIYVVKSICHHYLNDASSVEIMLRVERLR